MQSAAPGMRWVRGVFTEIRAAETRVSDPFDPARPLVVKGEVERRVPDCCTLCFTGRHRPQDCDLPEWFQVPTGEVLA